MTNVNTTDSRRCDLIRLPRILRMIKKTIKNAAEICRSNWEKKEEEKRKDIPITPTNTTE